LALTPGTRLGVYDITAALGEGGMGQVFRARDTKLNRDVALKVLPESFAKDADRLARFTREAQTLASLNHPHIAAIYGLEESRGVRALVMELVEGEDLSQRIARGAIPLDEALPIAKQITEALEAAHDLGIIHRDLKPANIKVRSDGTVKVLDFGLAKAMDAVGSAQSAADREPVSQSPTITNPALTQSGMILGTAAYMSPEQASGRPVDKRADIWSFGVVFFEMLSGQRLFGGQTIGHTLADVLRAPIDAGKLPKETPRVVRTVVARCLDRDVKTRLRDIGEARVTIGKYLADPANGEAPHGTRPARQWVAWAAAGVLAVFVIAGWLRPRPASSSPAADLVLTIAPVAGRLARVGDIHATPEISPDGSAVMFYGDGAHLRRLNQLAPESVRTGRFTNPGFWSPDSRSFVFTDGTNLKKMRVPDGAPEIITNGVAALVGGSWSNNGTLLIATPSGLYAVSAAGGVAKRIEVTGPTFKTDENRGFYWPEFLPSSEDFLVLSEPAARGIEQSEIYLATLRDGRAADLVLLMKNATAARYTPAGGGCLLFVRNDNLYAQTLNRTARKLEGEPELIQQSVASSPAFHVAHFSVSRAGVVVWRPGTAGLSRVTIFDRQGREVGTAGSPTVVQTLRLSPDETRLLIGFNATAWLLEPGRPGQQQLEHGSLDTLWASDGSKLLEAIPAGGKDISVVERPVTGEGAVRELAKPPGMGRLEDISPDGKTLLLSRGALDTAVFSYGLDGVQKDPKARVQTGETISHARFSPDGRWIVYTASSAGGGAGGVYSGGGTYVQPYPGPGLRQQLTSRGNYPVWRKDGREIVYLDEFQGQSYIWSVPVTAPGGEFRPGTPSPLFPARLPATTFGDLNFLAVSRDGSRFYIPQAVEQPESDVIHVRMGWTK
jgi:eukaryotic-like serine/threonine-protein kinase